MRLPRKAIALMLALLVTAGAFGVMMAATEPTPPPQTSNMVQLTGGQVDHIQPAYSPNGKYVAFSSDVAGSYRIWVVRQDGRKLSVVTSLPGDEVAPKWDPNGETIAFLWNHGQYSDLCLTSMVNDSSECVTGGSHVRDYSWSPGGLLLAYDAGNGTIRLRNMTSGFDTVFPFDGYARDPTFGTNSNTLYFSAVTDQGDFIWNATIGGNNVKQLSWEGSDIEPSVSPSGNYLMYLTNLSGRYEPWIVNLATGINIYLLNRPDLGLSYAFPRPPLLAGGTIPSWGPSGNNVLYISNDNGSSGTLYLVTLDVTVDLSQVFAFPMSMVLGLNVYNEVPLGAFVSDAQWSPTGNVVVETSISGFQQLVVLENGPPVHVGYGG